MSIKEVKDKMNFFLLQVQLNKVVRFNPTVELNKIRDSWQFVSCLSKPQACRQGLIQRKQFIFWLF